MQAVFPYTDSPASPTCPNYSLIRYKKTALQYNHNCSQPIGTVKVDRYTQLVTGTFE